MKIRQELLKIQGSPFDERGDRLEPEALPAEKVLVIDAPVTGSIDQQNHGAIRSSVNIQGNVGMFANKLRTMCAECRHFDGPAWERKRALLEGSKEGVAALNNIRWELINQGLGPADALHKTQEDETDLEHAIAFMGVCRALSEHVKDDVIVHPMGGCPPDVCTESAPNGYFEHANAETRLAGDKAYDRVMRDAQGRILK